MGLEVRQGARPGPARDGLPRGAREWLEKRNILRLAQLRLRAGHHQRGAVAGAGGRLHIRPRHGQGDQGREQAGQKGAEGATGHNLEHGWETAFRAGAEDGGRYPISPRNGKAIACAGCHASTAACPGATRCRAAVGGRRTSSSAPLASRRRSST